jgi:hypothetical protein
MNKSWLLSVARACLARISTSADSAIVENKASQT